jgi:hypothetical protein
MISLWKFRDATAMIDKITLKEHLTKCAAKIVFRKTDGSICEMTCTLMENYLPSNDEPVIRHLPRAENNEVLAVWDIDNRSWRSFRLDSIDTIEYIGVNRV